MTEWYGTSWNSIVGLTMTAVAIYASVILYTRIAGLRSFSKMSGFDFATTVAIGSMIATSVLTQSPPLAQALVAIGVVYGLQLLVARLRYRWRGFSRFVDNEPRLLMDGPEMLRDEMKRAGVTEHDLWAKLREANVLSLGQVRAVVLETTGDVSVLHGEEGGQTFDRAMLTGVRRPVKDDPA